MSVCHSHCLHPATCQPPPTPPTPTSHLQACQVVVEIRNNKSEVLEDKLCDLSPESPGPGRRKLSICCQPPPRLRRVQRDLGEAGQEADQSQCGMKVVV